MKISWPICLIVLNISLCKDQGYGDKQIIIMLNQYYKDYSKVKLLGNHTFTNNSETILIKHGNNVNLFNNTIHSSY